MQISAAAAAAWIGVMSFFVAKKNKNSRSLYHLCKLLVWEYFSINRIKLNNLHDEHILPSQAQLIRMAGIRTSHKRPLEIFRTTDILK